MTKTPVSFRETIQGVLPMSEIERHIMDGVVQAQKYIFRNFQKLEIEVDVIKSIHKVVAGNLFEDAGTYRLHDVVLGTFEPPSFYQVPQDMYILEQDYTERLRYARTKKEKIELCAWLVHRVLWIHPFFDYNGRTARLLGELFLLKYNLPLTTFRKISRVDFVKAVKQATDTQDLSLLIGLVQDS